MRYIRTKDGGIKIVRLESYDQPVKIVVDKDIAIETEIVKESGNLKDLFDAYVNVKISGEYKGDFYVYEDYQIAKYVADEKTTVIYGAILLIDRGLIFVAKLNEKGEWELL